MTPIYLKMRCLFCKNPLGFQKEDVGSRTFDLYTCRDCKAPAYRTLHRQLYFYNKTDLLSDNIQIDEYFITRHFRPSHPSAKYGCSIIYKEAIGVFDGDVDMQPIIINNPVCELDYIIELPWNDIEAVKRKLNLYTIFS